MRYMLVLAAIMCAGTAHAQRIRDLSLSPQETMRQPDITHSQNQPGGNNWSNDFGQTREGTPYTGNTQYGQNQPTYRYFMDSYCSQDHRPLVHSSHLAAMTSCMDDMRNKACDSFRRLPQDAQSSVDGATECIFSAEDTPYTETKACSRFEREQLALVKKYWNNPETAYAIVFIPDMVTNPQTFCTRR